MCTQNVQYAYTLPAPQCTIPFYITAYKQHNMFTAGLFYLDNTGLLAYFQLLNKVPTF